MKQTIFGYNQQALITLVDEYNKDLENEKKISIDCNDLVILDWFVYFTPKMDFITLEGKPYYWVNYSKTLDDLPLVAMSQRTFVNRLKKLVSLGILSFHLSKENGNKTYYTFGENYTFLIERSQGGMEKTFQRVWKNLSRGYGKIFPEGMEKKCKTLIYNNIIYNDSAIIDKTINDKTIIDKEKYKKEEAEPMALATKVAESENNILRENSYFDEILNHWNSLDIIHHKKLTPKTERKIKELLKEMSMEEIMFAMDRYNQILKDENYFFKYKWTLEEFITREKGIKEFKDDGGKWLNYLNSKQGQKFKDKTIMQMVDINDFIG